MLFAIPYPTIDPVLVEIGPFALRWYALAYIFGLLLAWQYARWMCTRPPQAVDRQQIDDYLVWATIGVVLGGRIGYVLFYQFGYFIDNPLQVFAVWKGGMSFHGGLLGVVVSAFAFARFRHVPKLPFADILFCVAPIGLLLGRLANFINGELVGRVTDVPWAMVFPGYGPLPRHPSQLYEATLEGAVLLIGLHLMWRCDAIRNRPGILSGAFLIGYALFRTVAELFREPDAHLGFLAGGLTMGQWLSLPMVLCGAALVLVAIGRR